MTARVLVVDDILANIKLLEARLTAEYFDVLTAMNGQDAIEICMRGAADIVLLDVMMPGMDGFEVCRRLKEHPKTHHIPVIMVTALDQPSDRVRGLAAGADDFLTKPVGDLALITRVKSHVRQKTLVDQLRMRAETSEGIGVQESVEGIIRSKASNGRILLVDDRPNSAERTLSFLAAEHNVEVETDPQHAIFAAAEGDYELVIISLSLREYDGLRLSSQIRSLERTRHLPIMVITEPDDESKLLRALDLGVNDYVMRPIDGNELMARVATQLDRKRYTEKLKENFQQSVELAITDGLTGLYNRRYLETHLGVMFESAAMNGKDLSLLIMDIDHFKTVNDVHGHDAGDDVLREFSIRLQRHLRGVDLLGRFGGEEFVAVMPNTGLAKAAVVAERLRAQVEEKGFPIAGGTKSLEITVSVGVASLDGPDDTPQKLLKRADEALYRAKRDGRNRVESDAA